MNARHFKRVHINGHVSRVLHARKRIQDNRNSPAAARWPCGWGNRAYADDSLIQSERKLNRQAAAMAVSEMVVVVVDVTAAETSATCRRSRVLDGLENSTELTDARASTAKL